MENITENREKCTIEKVGEQTDLNSSDNLEPVIVWTKHTVIFKMAMSKMSGFIL